MGASRRSAGEPLSMRRRDASVFVAKNWKMDSMQRALMSSQDRNPSAYATGFLQHVFAELTTLQPFSVGGPSPCLPAICHEPGAIPAPAQTRHAMLNRRLCYPLHIHGCTWGFQHPVHSSIHP